MDEGKVTIERRGHVLLIGLDRVPKRNAFDVAMYHDLATAYGTLDRDQDLRCGVLFAHGDHFTAGIDLAQWSPMLSAGRFPTLPEGAIDPSSKRGLDGSPFNQFGQCRNHALYQRVHTSGVGQGQREGESYRSGSLNKSASAQTWASVSNF